MLYESLTETVRPQSASIVFQRWLRKFHFNTSFFTFSSILGPKIWIFENLKPRSASIVFQRWLRKFYFQHLIFLIFLRFGAGFCKFSNFESGSYFELGIFKNWSQTSQNDSWDAPGSILRPFEKHHFSHSWVTNFSDYVGQWVILNTIKNKLSGALRWWIRIKIP